MGTGFMAFGLTMILRPGSVRPNFDRFTDYWKQGVGIHTRCHSGDCGWLEWP